MARACGPQQVQVYARLLSGLRMAQDEAFAGPTAPRTGPAQRHDLREIMVMTLCGVLCGAETWVGVAELTDDNKSWLRRYPVLAHGTPSHDTFGRLFQVPDAPVLEQCFRSWIAAIGGAAGHTDAQRLHRHLPRHRPPDRDRAEDRRMRRRPGSRSTAKSRANGRSTLARRVSPMPGPSPSLRGRRQAADRLQEHRASLLGLAPLG